MAEYPNRYLLDARLRATNPQRTVVARPEPILYIICCGAARSNDAKTRSRGRSTSLRPER